MQLNQLDDVRVKPNTYTYNFRCALPPQLPGSVKGLDGHIKYKVHVILASFSIFRNKKFVKKFCVVRPLNLNEYFDLRVTFRFSCSFHHVNDFLLSFFVSNEETYHCRPDQ